MKYKNSAGKSKKFPCKFQCKWLDPKLGMNLVAELVNSSWKLEVCHCCFSPLAEKE